MHTHPFYRCRSLFTFLRPCLCPHPRPRQRTRLKIPYGLHPARSFSTSPTAGATHHDTPASSLLSQTLDQRQRMARGSQADTVGPFTLGITHQQLGAAQNVKKWSELSTKGKVMRTTARTTNFTVIVLGAGLTAMLAYALASELFARNSPTVLYGKACSQIKLSKEIAQHLPGPLVFHNNPPSSSRPRHRNRHVSFQRAEDPSGREHLLLNFYVRTSSQGSSSFSLLREDGYIDRVWRSLQSLREDTWTWDDASVWGRDTLRSAGESARRLFLYLTGEAGSSSSSSSAYPFASSPNAPPGGTPPPMRRETHIGRGGEEGGGLWASVVGLFAGIGKSVGGAGLSGSGRVDERDEVYEEGEVHCDLIKDENGDFSWRYIIVDMPNSRARYPNRVFVERMPGVRDNEPVMHWT